MSINIKGKTNIGPIPEDPSIYYSGYFEYYNPITSRLVSVLNSGGTLSNTFNIGDSLWHPNTIPYANKVTTQQNGKILVSGRLYFYSSTTTNSLVRLNTDGSLDSSLVTGVGFNSDTADIQVQPDGKIILSGSFTNYNGSARNKIIRIDSGGTVDSSFIIGTGFNSDTTTLNLQADGKILVGGYFTTYSGLSKNRLVRLNTDGSIDNTFDIGTGFNAVVWDTAIQSDGKIVVVGEFTSYNGVTVDRRIVRLNTDGSVDNTFNVTVPVTINTLYSIFIQPDGKFLVGGIYVNGSVTVPIIRLNTDGSLDNTFNIGSGFLSTLGSPYINSLITQADGKIIAVGSFNSCNGYNFKNIIRLNTDGSVDNTFNAGYGFDSEVKSVTLAADNNIIVCGKFNSYNQKECSLNILKTNSYGSLDTSFNFGSGFNGQVNSIIRQNDKKLFVGGSFGTYNGISYPYIIRLNSDGSVDNTFIKPSEINSTVNDIIQQSDGKIIVSGFFTNLIIRLNSDGSVDNTFNVGSGFNNTINARLKIQSDGKILVGGNFTTYNGIPVNRIVRLNTDGSIDNTFNIGTAFNNAVFNFEIQSDGKIIVVGGFTSYNGTAKNRILRLNTDGSIDNAFNVGTGFNNAALTIKLLKNNKILVGGIFVTYNGTSRSFMVRINNDGSLDTGYPNLNPGISVYTGLYPRVIVEDLQNRVLIGGTFQKINGTIANKIVRLTADGLIDTSFNSGTGFFSVTGTAAILSMITVKV